MAFWYKVGNTVYRFIFSAKIAGDIGVVYFLYEDYQIDQFENLTQDGAHPYTLVLPLNLFARVNVLKLRELQSKSLISGAIFYYGDIVRDTFSNDDTIPNRYTYGP